MPANLLHIDLKKKKYNAHNQTLGCIYAVFNIKIYVHTQRNICFDMKFRRIKIIHWLKLHVTFKIYYT